jgi:hypothetical protein
MCEANPTLARRELAVYFSWLRERHERSLDDLARVLEVGTSQASRLDTGARGFSVRDVRTLARWYGLDDADTDRLVAIANEARHRAWWQQVDLPPPYRTLIGLERAARSIYEHSATVIPGLLQTRQYAEAAVRITAMGLAGPAADQAVTVRIRRQKILERPDPPRLSVVIDEAALARGAGGTAVMQQQLEHLLDLSERPEVTIQVIGFESGLYPSGPFILLRMSRDLPDVLYRETSRDSYDTSEPKAVSQARQHWEDLKGIALPPVQSQERIVEYRRRQPLHTHVPAPRERIRDAQQDVSHER